jgi:hypothetical protein
MDMKPGDVIILGKKMWEITGIYLGGTGTQDMVGVKAINSKPGYTGNGSVKEMLFPMEFLDKMNEDCSVVFTKGC